MAIYKGFNIPRGHWIGFTSLVVLQPDYGATRQKLGQRLLGLTLLSLGFAPLRLRLALLRLLPLGQRARSGDGLVVGGAADSLLLRNGVE